MQKVIQQNAEGQGGKDGHDGNYDIKTALQDANV
jgi:hypothetical protein